MSLQVPSFAAPQYAATQPVANAYAWILGLATDFWHGAGTVTVGIFANAAAANANCTPLAQLSISLGQELVPATDKAPAVTFPTLVQLFTLAAQLQAATPANTPDQSLRAAIYQSLLSHPLFAGSIQVP